MLKKRNLKDNKQNECSYFWGITFSHSLQPESNNSGHMFKKFAI